MKNKIVLRSVLVLALFAVLAISTASALDSEYYLFPDNSGVEGYGNTVNVELRLNATQAIQTGKVSILYEEQCADITGFTRGPEWEWGTKIGFPGEYVITVGNEDDNGIPVDLPEGNYLIGTYTIQCNSTTPCVTNLLFELVSWSTDLASLYVEHVPFTVDNGTFSCIGEPETFNKELLAGWNLISLPLTATDMTVANVIDASLTYDELQKYDTTTHSYVAMESTDTMENGVGYFVNITTDSDMWTYSGSAYMSMNEDLSDGLNMVGWLNCSKDIVGDGALSSIDGNYFSAWRWDAAIQDYEVYNPRGDINHFTMMERGEGYFISADVGCPALTKNC